MYIIPDDYLKDAKRYLNRLAARYTQQSVLFYGKPNTGKSELLCQIKEEAVHLGILNYTILIKNSKNFETTFKNIIKDVIKEVDIYKSVDLESIITLEGAIMKLGNVSREQDKPICIFIDNIHILRTYDLGSLLKTLKAMNKLYTPMLFFMFGRKAVKETLDLVEPCFTKSIIYQEVS